MYKKQTKLKTLSSTSHSPQPLVETPKFKDVKFKLDQKNQKDASNTQSLDQQYFSFGGLNDNTFLKSQKLVKPQSRSFYMESKQRQKSLNNSFTHSDAKKVIVQKPAKVQIFNNNYQIINLGQQIDKKDSIRSLQKQLDECQKAKHLNFECQSIKQGNWIFFSQKLFQWIKSEKAIEWIQKVLIKIILKQMKNKSLSPKYKAMTFDYYQIGQQQLQKMKSEKLIIQQKQKTKPILNLQLIMKGHSQYEKQQPQSARSNTLQDLLFRHQHRIQSNGIKQKQPIDELEKIKLKFLRISSKWKAKEEYYTKQLRIANQEITRLNQIISTLSKSE